jgi:tetratricopeptide (TPR) repeat protein
MNKLVTLLIILSAFSTAYGQIAIGTPGAQQIFGAVSSLGRDIVRAAEYKKEKEAQEAREAEYAGVIAQADELFIAGKYREAGELYNQALTLKQDQYPRDQIARCNAELARVNKEEYQLLIDKADSSYAQMNYDLALKGYTEALTKKDLQYPKDQIRKIKEDQGRWNKVHFSGLLISDSRTDELSSRAYANDPFSDFMKTGKYHLIDEFLVYSNFQTLDGIAVPANTRLVIYSEPYFKGEVLLDITGPAIVNNQTKKTHSPSTEAHSREFIAPLQTIFPPSVRSWSNSDMNKWIKGSMEISTL